MRIGMVCYASVGGSGVVATELAHALVDRGHHVHLISSDPPFRWRPGPHLSNDPTMTRVARISNRSANLLIGLAPIRSFNWPIRRSALRRRFGARDAKRWRRDFPTTQPSTRETKSL